MSQKSPSPSASLPGPPNSKASEPQAPPGEQQEVACGLGELLFLLECGFEAIMIKEEHPPFKRDLEEPALHSQGPLESRGAGSTSEGWVGQHTQPLSAPHVGPCAEWHQGQTHNHHGRCRITQGRCRKVTQGSDSTWVNPPLFR